MTVPRTTTMTIGTVMSAKPLWRMAEDRALADLLDGFHVTEHDASYGAYGSVGGSRMNQRTHDALVIAHYLAGRSCSFTQGGLNGGVVKASAHTHDGLDVADTVAKGLSIATIREIVSCGMDCGAIGFIRGVTEDHIADGMPEHVHWVMVGAEHAHPDARAQLYNHSYGYAHGGAGLAGLPKAKWWGPDPKPLIDWQHSRYNPANGWRP